MYDLGIVIAAQGIDDAEIEQFKSCLRASNPQSTYLLEVVTDSPQSRPLFSKPQAINYGLRKLLPQCHAVVQTDVDILIPEGAIDYTVEHLRSNPRDCCWIVSRELRDFDGSFHWDQWQSNMVRENMSGSWISMTSDNWWIVGGYNEDLWGWGSDDWEIASRITYRGIDCHKVYKFPLMHVEHANREYKTRERLMANDQLRFSTPRCRNFLQGNNPDFIILGAQKSGTTFLIDSLEKHPDVFVPRAQTDVDLTAEVHFFNRKWGRGADWYRSHFVSRKKLVGEKTPEYFNMMECHQRIKETCPDAKLIVLFRDPVARAYSALNHARQVDGNWSGEIYNDVPLSQAFRRIVFEGPARCLIDFSIYAPKLASLYGLFDREQIHIEIFERLIHNKPQAFDRVCRFLEIDRCGQSIPFRISNERSYPEPMPEDAADALRVLLRPSVDQLREMLGEEIPEWTL